MKKILISLLFLAGCSPNNSKQEVTQNTVESLQSQSGIVISPESGVFDSVGSDVTSTFTVTSTSNTGRDANISLEKGTEGFSLLTANCTNFSKLRSCTVRVKFTVGSRANGLYLDKMIMDDAQVSLSANLNKPVPVSDTSGLKIAEGAVENISSLSFGVLSSTGSVSKSLVIKDALKGIKNTVQISSSSANFSVLTTSCAPTLVNSSTGCSIRVQFSANGKTAGLYEGNLLVADKVIPMSATIQSGTVISGTSDLRILIADVESSNQNFGSIATGSKSSVLVKVKNQGTGAATGLTMALSGSTAFSATSSTCSSVVQAGATCQLTLNLSAVNVVGLQSGSLSYGGKSLSLQAQITGSCAVDKHAENGACVSNIQSENITNGIRSKIYSVGSSAWGNWVYRCNAGFVASGEACVQARPPAPQVTIALSQDETSLIVTATCKTNLYGLFLDMFHEIDNPAPSYDPPYSLDGSFLHEDLGGRNLPCVVVDAINHNGLMTVNVPITASMRTKNVYAHAIQLGSVMWDNNLNSDFSSQVSVLVPALVEPSPQGITLVNINQEPNPKCMFGSTNLYDVYSDQESCETPHTFHWEAATVPMVQCSNNYDTPESCGNSGRGECSWAVDYVESRSCEEIASDESVCSFYSNCQWTYIDEQDPDQGGNCLGTTDYEYGYCDGQYASGGRGGGGGGGHGGPGGGSSGTCRDENGNRISVGQFACSASNMSFTWTGNADKESNVRLTSIIKDDVGYSVTASSSDLYTDRSDISVRFNLTANSPRELIRDMDDNEVRKTWENNSVAYFNNKLYSKFYSNNSGLGYVENGVVHIVVPEESDLAGIGSVSNKLVYLMVDQIKVSSDGQNFENLNFDFAQNGPIHYQTVVVTKDYMYFQTQKSLPNSRALYTLWRTNGTEAGTIQLYSEVLSGSLRGLDLFLLNYNQNLVAYYGNWGSFNEWTTDDPNTKYLNSAYSLRTTSGTVASNQIVLQVPSTDGANPGGLNLYQPVVVRGNNEAYVIARIGTEQKEKILKISSGASTNLMSGMDANYHAMELLGVVNGKVYAFINNENEETNLFVEQNGQMILEQELNGLYGDSSENNGYEKMYGHKLYFINNNSGADADGEANRLYEYNTVTHTLRKIVTEGEVDAYVILGDVMFLTIKSPVYGNELYFWDLSKEP